MIGSGDKTKEYQAAGWTCLDGDPNSGADIIACVPSLPESVTSKKWRVVCAIHFIEHLYYEDAKQLITEIYGVLDKQGRLILEQANLAYVCRVILGEIKPPVEKYPWMNGHPEWCGIWSMYPQPHMINGNELNHHLYGYTPESLLELVKDCGFEHASVGGGGSHVAERDFRVEALR